MNELSTLFQQITSVEAETITELSASGSNRKYYRLAAGDLSLIGVEGTSVDENRAFIRMAQHFVDKGLPVPCVLAVSADEMCYLGRPGRCVAVRLHCRRAQNGCFLRK